MENITSSSEGQERLAKLRQFAIEQRENLQEEAGEYQPTEAFRDMVGIVLQSE